MNTRETWHRGDVTITFETTDGTLTITREAFALLLVDAGFQMGAVVVA